jgi:hypothetical protein
MNSLTNSTNGLRNIGTFCAKKRTKVANITESVVLGVMPRESATWV